MYYSGNSTVKIVPEIRARLRKLGTKERAKVSRRFFKTGPGEYGEGDIFLGVTVPELRQLAASYQAITLREVTQLLRSTIHEERLLALLILCRTYAGGDESAKKTIYELYLRNSQFVNNWDLVDASAEHIVGAFLVGKSKRPLYALARSSDLWERRIAIMATFHFIKRGAFAETIKIARILLSDEEDLIHKAVGWMLREVGKRRLETAERFLRKHCTTMPRTMLRYAIERFPEPKRQRYLKEKG
ncbi:MAG: DNA alkylation repair protein [Deltaproteobacteria bacterium RBG_16_54_11]|nr:MAG: DNA alkylation repair protein [Deltaproteobacteria bacterium RBG_16_54_11]